VDACRDGAARDIDARPEGLEGDSRVRREHLVLLGELLPSCVVGVVVRWAAVNLVR
jgi:hypothetical protein